ncbi:MAG: PKD domain-containing protein [Deltaproteobacteria bacterium]|nr:PKD domain-containing protein [Deltaproteobacteria bacterium]
MKLFKPLIYSAFSIVIFTGIALAQTTVHEQGFNSSISPWYEWHPSETTADWSTTSSGSSPSCSPYEGDKMAEFNSDWADSYDEAVIESPDLNLTGAEVAEFRFWMNHDTGSNNDDLIKFQISRDGGERFYTQYEFKRYDGSDGWAEHVVPLGNYTTYSNLQIAFRGYSRHGNNIFVDHIRVLKDTLANGVEGKGCSAGGECNSGICGVDPGGNGRCREAGTTCIDGHRMPVGQGTVTCYDGNVATCNGTDNWSVVDCFDDCGPYLDVHDCDMGSCADCGDGICIVFGDEGCDDNAYCQPTFIFIGICVFEKENGEICESNDECISDNCVASPSGTKFCQASGVVCSSDTGDPVTAGTSTCAGGDLWTCQAGGGWSTTDCLTNCGFYIDVDECIGSACSQCATSCDGNEDCKPGILCISQECVGNLDIGSTCTLDTQCESDHCIDGVCCQDICTTGCYRCDIQNSEGTCTAIPDGQDPDGECSGSGVCAGSCNGFGGCNYPDLNTVCDICARCNSLGQCNLWVQADSDPADECPDCQVCNGSAAGCLPVSSGQDPLNECTAGPQDDCGLDGNCDGSGACRYWPAGTECSVGSCSNGMATFADICDGSGLCTDGGSGSCGFFRCADATRCADSCTTHAACISTGYCAVAGQCAPDLGEGADCENIVFAGQIDDAACMGGYCFDDNFDASGAFCTSDPAGCVNNGVGFNSGYALCQGADWYRVCQGGALGWGAQTDCLAGLCDAGGGEDSGYRPSGLCNSGPGGGCTATCQGCEPYMAFDDSSCRTSCSSATHCWPGYACQGSVCKIPEGIGDPCDSQDDCSSAGTCIDGVCCNDSCQGACRACNLPGHEGFCTMVDEGEDPDGDCQALPEITCSTTGDCDGHGSCLRWEAETICGQAHCEGNILKGGAICNGAGDCLEDTDTDCRPGRCEADSCINTCLTHPDCDPLGFCAAGGSCQIDLADGESCADVVHTGLEKDPACLGGYCFEDSWSETDEYCASDESACVALGSIYSPGYRLCNNDEWFRICLGGRDGWGPENVCGAADVCDAGGGADSGVRPAETCESGFVGGCSTACVSCFPYRAEQPGVCAQACVEDADCWTGYFCPAGVCEAGSGLGDACLDAGDCTGWACVDGVCCNSDCANVCQVCNDPSALGVCIFVRAGTDPSDDCEPAVDICGITGACDGEGACEFAQAGTVCADASCTAGVFTVASTCNGQGECVTGNSQECESGSCQGDKCALVETDGGPDGGDRDGGITDAGGDIGQVPPVAEAGPTQVVKPQSLVTLDGSQSRDPNGDELTFMWNQTSGPVEVALAGSTTAGPQFTPAREGVYVFRLVVNDGAYDSDPDYTEVQVTTVAAGCGCSSSAGQSSLLFILVIGIIKSLRKRK